MAQTLTDPIQVQSMLDEILEKIPGRSNRAYDLRHAILYFMFPDRYERIISTAHKQKILSRYIHFVSDPETDIDTRLFQIRQQIASTHPKGQDFDFYNDFRQEWDPDEPIPPAPPQPGSIKISEGTKKDGKIVSDALRLINRYKNLILFGPPGTGKDIDHVLPAQTLDPLLALLPLAPPETVYTFARRDAPDLRVTLNDRGEPKPHPNTFAMQKAWFWKVGGYDEDCVGYGTDAYFRTRLKASTRLRHLEHLYIVRYPREVIADANSSPPGVDPKAFRNRGRRGPETQRRLANKRKHHLGPRVLDFPWARVLCLKPVP